MPSDHDLAVLASQLAGVPGVVGVALGGSRARREHLPISDWDVGLYYRGAPDLDVLAELARRVAGPQARVTGVGEWGPWVDGGAWLRIGGEAVDWIYRDLDRVHRAWADASRGRCRFHVQAGHPLGVLDVAYAGELAVARLLADPTGELTDLQARARRYPPLLADELVAGLWEAAFLVSGARKGAARGDAAFVADCLFRAVGVCCHALHGRAGRWLLNEKGMVEAAARVGAPPGFALECRDLLGAPGRTVDELSATLDRAERLVAAVEVHCTR